jgi:hypothetical protein
VHKYSSVGFQAENLETLKKCFVLPSICIYYTNTIARFQVEYLKIEDMVVFSETMRYDGAEFDVNNNDETSHREVKVRMA